MTIFAKHKRMKCMTNNDKKEQNIDYDFILGKGIADYSDGDLVIIDKIGAKPIEGTVKLDMVLMIYCKKDVYRAISTTRHGLPRRAMW